MTDDEFFDSLPDGVREIYRGVLLLGVAENMDPDRMKETDPDFEDIPSYLRSISEAMCWKHTLGGIKIDTDDLGMVRRLHDQLWDTGKRGLAVLLSRVLFRITSHRADLRGQEEEFRQLFRTDIHRIREEEDLSSDAWLRDILRSFDVNPDLVWLLDEVDRLIAEEEGYALTGPDDVDSGSGGSAVGDSRVQEYRSRMANPVVEFLGSVLDRIRDGKGGGDAVIQDAGEAMEDLASVDSEYLESPFLPLSIERNTWGGRVVSVLFRNRPDRVYSAWVYGQGPGDYRLRGFWPAEMDDGQLETLLQDPTLAELLKNDSLTV